MPSFTTGWDETKPAGSRNLNLGDDDIREFKQQVRERCNVDGYFPSSDDGTTGYHRKITFYTQASDPAQVADALILYAKTVGSYEELFSRHENAALQQLTLNGKLWIEALTIASIAQGDIFYYDGTKVTRLGVGTSGQLLKTQGASANPLWATLELLNGHVVKNVTGDTFSTALSVAARSAARTLTIPDEDVNLGEQLVKTWVNFNGTNGTINDHYGVTSVVRNSTGNYTITWSKAFANVNYVIFGTAKQDGADKNNNVVVEASVGNPAVGSCIVEVLHAGSPTDCDVVMVAAIGNY